MPEKAPRVIILIPSVLYPRPSRSPLILVQFYPSVPLWKCWVISVSLTGNVRRPNRLTLSDCVISCICSCNWLTFRMLVLLAWKLKRTTRFISYFPVRNPLITHRFYILFYTKTLRLINKTIHPRRSISIYYKPFPFPLTLVGVFFISF